MNDLQHLDSEWIKPFIAVLRFFNFTGLYFFDEYRPAKFIKIKYIYFVFHVMITLSVCHFIGVAISNGLNLIHLATDISHLLISLESACILYLHFFYSHKKIKTFIRNVFKECRDDENISVHGITLRRNILKSFARFNYGYLAGIFVFVHLYMGVPLVTVIVKKFIYKEQVLYVLPFGVTVPFDYEDNFVTYVMVYGCIYYMTYNLSYVINGGLVLFTACISQLRLLFDLLQDEFRDILNSEDDFNRDEKIKRTIRKHSRLMKLIREISDAFGAIFALHLLLLAAVICFFGITAMVSGNLGELNNITASIISICTIYHCCNQGQLLVDSAVDVGWAIYDSKWYSLSCEHKKVVLIIILRSQQITYIQSTGFTYISLTAFVKIMNTAYSFISLITGMYKEN